jgi:hypothetical protein
VLLATARFADFARESAIGYGLPTARIAVVEHPLGGVLEDGIVARAAEAVEQVLRLLAPTGG